MPDVFANLDSAFPLLFSAAFAWVLLWILASVIYRKSMGKPLIPRKPDNTLFFESTGSGHSNQNLFTRLGGARNCLSVAITDKALIIQPTFPFNLMFLPEIYGLEYNIPRENIHSMSVKEAIFGRTVTLEFTRADGTTNSIDLRLRGADQFLKVIKQYEPAL